MRRLRSHAAIPIGRKFVTDLPLTHDTMIAEWALAPHGPALEDRGTSDTDRSRKVNHTPDSLCKRRACPHRCEEVEFPAGSGRRDRISNYFQITVQKR